MGIRNVANIKLQKKAKNQPIATSIAPPFDFNFTRAWVALQKPDKKLWDLDLNILKLDRERVTRTLMDLAINNNFSHDAKNGIYAADYPIRLDKSNYLLHFDLYEVKGAREETALMMSLLEKPNGPKLEFYGGSRYRNQENPKMRLAMLATTSNIAAAIGAPVVSTYEHRLGQGLLYAIIKTMRDNGSNIRFS